MHVSYTSHGNEGEVVQEPADNWIEAGVVEVVHLSPGELIEAALPADSVPCEHPKEEDDREGRAPVDCRVAQEEVFDDVIVPTAHT